MSDTKYNGWANYETWLVNLWIDNDQGSQEYWQERATELLTDARTEEGKDDDDARSNLADCLKTHFEEEAEGLSGVSGFWADLIGSALSEVDWREIAEHMIEDASEGMEEV